jgi:hypothetical protein
MSTISRKGAVPGFGAESRAPVLAAGGREGAGAAAKTSAKVTFERIQARAYEIFRSRNSGPGDAVSDWLTAERELNGSAPSATAGVEVEARQRARGEALLASGGK